MRATLVAVLVSGVLGVVKVLAGVVGHSYALIADGVESMLDIFGSIVSWSGLRIAAKPADEKHPYGHGKAEPLAAMLIAVGLLTAAAVIAIQSAQEIRSPHRAPAPFTLVVLVVTVVTKELLFRYLARAGRRTGSRVLETDAWHHRSDALTSLAAFIGISVSLAAGPGYETADDWAALAASGVIAFNGVRLLRGALDDVMDAVPSPEVEERIRELSAAIDGVTLVELCRVRRSGLGFFVDLHVWVPGDLSVREGHRIAHEVKDVLLEADIGLLDATIHVEPDVDRGGRASRLAGADPASSRPRLSGEREDG